MKTGREAKKRGANEGKGSYQIDRCAWETYGERCQMPGTISASPAGGPYFCSQHAGIEAGEPFTDEQIQEARTFIAEILKTIAEKFSIVPPPKLTLPAPVNHYTSGHHKTAAQMEAEAREAGILG